MLSKWLKKSPDEAPILLCGLGNPGEKYEKTRHNAGFMAIDAVAEKYGAKINRLRFMALTGQAEIAGRRVIFMKPQTYMNNSGEAVAAAAKYYKIPPEDIVIISDDVNLAAGVLRIREKGSDGGHNGLKSIAAHLSSESYPRLRIGVGTLPHPDYDMADWVLSRLTESEQKAVSSAALRICEALPLIIEKKFELAKSKYNG